MNASPADEPDGCASMVLRIRSGTGCTLSAMVPGGPNATPMNGASTTINRPTMLAAARPPSCRSSRASNGRSPPAVRDPPRGCSARSLPPPASTQGAAGVGAGRQAGEAVHLHDVRPVVMQAPSARACSPRTNRSGCALNAAPRMRGNARWRRVSSGCDYVRSLSGHADSSRGFGSSRLLWVLVPGLVEPPP